MKNLLGLTIVLFSIIAVSCKKEKTTWNSNWNVPLLHGVLDVNNIKNGENFEENGNNFASLIYNDTLFSFSIDTLIKLPDTTLTEKRTTSFPNLTLAPGNLISSSGVDQLYDLGEIELKRVIVNEGTAIITMKSPWPGKTKAVFSFDKVWDANGDLFVKTYYLEAGSQANPTVATETIDMKDFDFDLTGSTGDLYNNITASLVISSAEEVSSFVVTNQDTIELQLEFKDMTPKYAKGYFGEYELSDTTTVAISQLKQVISGQLELDSINLNLHILNGFKLLTQATFTQFKGYNSSTNNYVGLTFPQLNTVLNINSASGGFYDYTVSDYLIAINSGNSNVLDFIQNLPDEIEVGYRIHINPFGNSTAGDDEYFPNSSLDLVLDGELPLNFSANNLTIVDTFDFSFDLPENPLPKYASIKLDYINTFAIGAEATIHILDISNTNLSSISSSTAIIPATYNNITGQSTASTGTVTFNLTEDDILNLDIANALGIELTFFTSNNEKVKINMDHNFMFNLFSDLNIDFKL